MTLQSKMDDKNSNVAFWHICEVCGRSELLTVDEAYDDGWDYPPTLGTFRVVSPRTCPQCSIMDTAWAELVVRHKSPRDLTDEQLAVLFRILSEPESLMP